MIANCFARPGRAGAAGTAALALVLAGFSSTADANSHHHHATATAKSHRPYSTAEMRSARFVGRERPNAALSPSSQTLAPRHLLPELSPSGEDGGGEPGSG